MKKLFINGSFYENHNFTDGSMLVEHGFIQAIGKELGKTMTAGNTRVIDLGGRQVVPGFIDIHTHGAVGVDVNGANADGFEKISRFFASQGTTGWLCSVLADTREQTLYVIDQYKNWKQQKHSGAELLVSSFEVGHPLLGILVNISTEIIIDEVLTKDPGYGKYDIYTRIYKEYDCAEFAWLYCN